MRLSFAVLPAQLGTFHVKLRNKAAALGCWVLFIQKRCYRVANRHQGRLIHAKNHVQHQYHLQGVDNDDQNNNLKTELQFTVLGSLLAKTKFHLKLNLTVILKWLPVRGISQNFRQMRLAGIEAATCGTYPGIHIGDTSTT